MQELSDGAAFWILIVVVLALLFFLPTLIGLIRGVDGLAIVFLVNLIGAPALIGWPAALILAFGPRRPGAATARRRGRNDRYQPPPSPRDWRRQVP